MKRLLSLAFLFFATPALAQTAPPKGVDFTQPILGVDSKPLKEGDIALTRGAVVASCLVQEKGGSPSLYALATRIVNAKDATLTNPEIHAIETCIDKLSPLVSGQIDPAIDPTFKFAPVQ